MKHKLQLDPKPEKVKMTIEVLPKTRKQIVSCQNGNSQGDVVDWAMGKIEASINKQKG
jgi:hypothetical protein